MQDPEPFLSQLLGSASGSNIMGISDPETDAALERARGTSDLDTRVQALRIVQDRLRSDLPFLLFARPVVAMISNPDVGGFRFYGKGAVTFDGVWLDRSAS